MQYVITRYVPNTMFNFLHLFKKFFVYLQNSSINADDNKIKRFLILVLSLSTRYIVRLAVAVLK